MDKNISKSENRMNTEHEGKLLLTMGAALMFSMLIQALYNIVDSFFVARIPDLGEAAVNALTLAFPIQMIMMALTVGTGVGVCAVLSRYLGENDYESVNKTAGNTMFLYACYYVLLLLFGLFCTKKYILAQTNDTVIAGFGITYLKIVCCFSFANIGEKCFEKLLQSTGKTTYSMFGQMSGALVNVVLDPILIFGYFGLPAMGVKGAAIATIIGQCFAIFISGTLHFCKNTEINHRLKYLCPDKIILSNILKIGTPAIFMQSLICFMTYGMNIILGGISSAYVTAYGIYYKLQNFIFMPAFGLNNAVVPIIGYNYGAKNYTRIKNTIFYAVITVLIIMAAGFILFQGFSYPIMNAFALSENTTKLCVSALKIVSFSFVFAGINILLQGICQALGNGVYSLYISMIRLIIIVLPLSWLISKIHGVEMFIWNVFLVAEILAFVIGIVLTCKLYRRTIGIK